MTPDLYETLPRWLCAREYDEATCLMDGGASVSRGELLRRTRRLSTGLAELGISKGDRVAVWLPNRTAWLVSFLACAQLGAIAVSINTRFRSGEMGDLLRRSSASVLIYWPTYKGIDFTAILSQCSSEALQHLRAVVLYDEEGGSLPDTVADRPAEPFHQLLARPETRVDAATGDTPCIIFTTTGTTNAPKLVVHNQQTVLRHAHNVARQYELDETKRFLLVPPFCGVFGFCIAMAALAGDSLLVLEPAWSVSRAADLITQHRITHLTASSDAIAQLLDASSHTDDFESLEIVSFASFDPPHADIALRAAEQGITMVGLYGSSELQALFSRGDTAADPKVRGRAGGRPASSLAKVRTRHPETQRLCAPDEPGELEFFAPESAFMHYFNDPVATQSAFTEDGYFRSGDLGTLNEDGQSFTYLARMNDSLRLGGFLVSPAEIEAVVQEHPSVDSCQVVGARIKDAVRPVAFVIARRGAQILEKELIALVSARLAKYKVPVRVVALDEFPMTLGANGTKVQKIKLRDMAEKLLSDS